VTIRELIEHLQKLNGELPVIVRSDTMDSDNDLQDWMITESTTSEYRKGEWIKHDVLQIQIP
jgi:hypothetical protein